MSFRDCMNRAVAGGEMSRDRAERILREYEGALPAFQERMGYRQAEVEAARHVVARARAEAKETRRRQQLQAAVTAQQLERMERYRDIRGRLNPVRYLQALIESPRGAMGNTLSGRYQAIRRRARSQFTDALKTFRANLVGGRRNAATQAAVLDEIFGKSTGNAHAAGIAQAFSRIAEELRTRFNAAGGHIPFRENWGLPQFHNARRVARVSFEEWRDFIMPRLDLDQMAEMWNDGMPWTPERLETVMFDAYEAIRTDGRSRRDPSAQAQGSALYNRRADHRFFQFRDGEAWATYNARFGSGDDAFRTMIGHLDNMAMDIAMMEQLGPNPLHTFRYLTDAARTMNARSTDPIPEEGGVGGIGGANGMVATAEHMLELFRGNSLVPVNAKIARGASAIRQFLTSAHLGSAVLSSVTDFNNQRMAARFVGMNGLGFMKQLTRLATSPTLRETANDAGLVFENAINVGNAVARYEMENLHVETAARLADFTIRASGMGWLTEVQRQAFGLEFMGEATRWIGRGWQELNPKTRRAFESYGITERMWPAFQRIEPHETPEGLRLVRYQEVEAELGGDVADAWLEMISSLTEFAVPSTNLFGRAVVTGNTRPGSLGGELVRFGLQFKAFPITMMVTQMGRSLAEAYDGRVRGAAGYFAGVFIGGTILGALAIQMKEVAKGRDPRDMTTPAFWNAAMLQGGGLGIFGDFFFSDVNRFGSGVAQTIAGPGVGFIDDMIRYTVGNARELAYGESTNMGEETVRLLRRYTPGGSLWYLRLAYEREILDRLQGLLDPEAYQSFRARERSAREYDTQFFAPPGRGLFDGARAPDFGNMAGG
jgi:hypothetical protein